MSRYDITSAQYGGRYAEIIVGWDASLNTFFIMAYKPGEDEDNPSIYHGQHRFEMESYTDLNNYIQVRDPNIVIPDNIASRLMIDMRDETFEQAPRLRELTDMLEKEIRNYEQ